MKWILWISNPLALRVSLVRLFLDAVRQKIKDSGT